MKLRILFQPKVFLIISLLMALAPLFIWPGTTRGLPPPLTRRTWTQPETALILFAGDIMVHETQIEAAYDPQTRSYNFHPCFELIKPFIKYADLAVANLETTLAGKESYYTGYPAFNSPEQLAPALKDAGFDVICTANNHSMDRGEYGVLKTLEHLHRENLRTFGTHRSFEERERFLIVEVKGIKLGFLAYTYGTNGIPIPEGKEYLVNLLVPELIKADIKKIRGKADLVILYLHWGTEYMRESSPSQAELAETLLNSGADLIIGNHPHVVQPVEFFNQNHAGGGGKLAAYALGNFISDQVYPYTDSGIALYVTLSKESGGKVRIKELSYIPVWAQKYDPFTGATFRIVPAPEYLKEWADANKNLVDFQTFHRSEEVKGIYKKHLPFLKLKAPGEPGIYN